MTFFFFLTPCSAIASSPSLDVQLAHVDLCAQVQFEEDDDDDDDEEAEEVSADKCTVGRAL